MGFFLARSDLLLRALVYGETCRSTFLHSARTIIASVDEAEEQMDARRMRPAGLLRVDAATPFMLHMLVLLITGFRERYPEVELELNCSEGIIDLIEKRTDMAFRIGVRKDSTLHARTVDDCSSQFE